MNLLRTIALTLAAAAGVAAEPLAAWRAWQFHKLDMPYVLASLKLARNYDVNTVVFSQDMLGCVSQLLDGSDHGTRLTLRWSGRPHSPARTVHCW